MPPTADDTAAPPLSIPPDLALHDAHCHPTDTPSTLSQIPQMRASSLVIMSTRSDDQNLVHETASKLKTQNQTTVIPAFGWHPWFSHQLYDDTSSEQPTYNPADPTFKTAHYATILTPGPSPDTAFIDSLPTPIPLKAFLAETRDRLLAHPQALVGEIGVDKAFRLPDASGSEGGRRLSQYRVRMPHQAAIFAAQLRLAAELDRAVSVHCVQASGTLLDTLASLWKGHEKEVIGSRKRKMVAEGAEDFSESEDEDAWESDGAGGGRKKPKPFPPRICLHSFSGSLQTLKQYLNPTIPASIFVSFSSSINFGTAGAKNPEKINVVREVPENRLLLESDLHTAGEEMDRALEDVYGLVCDIRGWDISEGARMIGRNFDEFISG